MCTLCCFYFKFYIVVSIHLVYRDCYGLSPLKTIYKHFHFQFEVDYTFNDVKVKNALKITSIQKLVVL